MKKILIFYSSHGGGHLSAANAISTHLEKYYPEATIKMVDCIEYINKYLNKASVEAYKEVAKKVPWIWKRVYQNSKHGALSHISATTNKLMAYKLNLLLQSFKPDLIISTHPFATQMCAILKKRDKIDCKLATILTDYHIHPQWLILYKYVDYFFVSNDSMKIDMVSEGVDNQKIFVTGIPVSERFSETKSKREIYKNFELSPRKDTVLFFGGGEFGLGRNTAYMTLKAFIRLFPNLQIVVVSGKNKKMKKRFAELIANTDSSDRVKLFDFVNTIPELMYIARIVVTKPGGLTISESLVSKLPIIVINPIPGQEEENAQFLVDNGAAIWIKKGDNIARTIKTLYRKPELLVSMKENATILAKPHSTKEICKILLNEIY